MKNCEIIVVGGISHRFLYDEVRGPIWLNADGSLPSEAICPNSEVWATFAEWNNWREKENQTRLAYQAKSL